MNDKVREELVSLDRGGKLVDKEVVERASDPESALHKYFIWDDAEAARVQRLGQARSLIATIKIAPAGMDPPRKIRAYESLPSDRANSPGTYRAIGSIMADEDRRRELLNSVRKELAQVYSRYQHLEELVDVWNAIVADAAE